MRVRFCFFFESMVFVFFVKNIVMLKGFVLVCLRSFFVRLFVMMVIKVLWICGFVSFFFKCLLVLVFFDFEIAVR